jgi:hypothetical protein
MRFKGIGEYVLVDTFGALYVIDAFRDGSGRVYTGINGKDGVNYTFNVREITRVLTYDEFTAGVAQQ